MVLDNSQSSNNKYGALSGTLLYGNIIAGMRGCCSGQSIPSEHFHSPGILVPITVIKSIPACLAVLQFHMQSLRGSGLHMTIAIDQCFHTQQCN